MAGRVVSKFLLVSAVFGTTVYLFSPADAWPVAERTSTTGTGTTTAPNGTTVPTNRHQVQPRELLDKALSSSATAQGLAEIASDVLQVVGRIVVKRATRTAWALLRSRVKSSLRCRDKPDWFPSLCKTLDTVRIQNLLAQPGVLARGFVVDVLGTLTTDRSGSNRNGVLRRLIDELKITSVLDLIRVGLIQRGAPGAITALMQDFRANLYSAMNNIHLVQCEKTQDVEGKVVSVIYQCIEENMKPKQPIHKWIGNCALKTHVRQCVTPGSVTEQELYHLVSTVVTILKAQRAVDAAPAVIHYYFELARSQVKSDPNKLKLLDHLEEFILGIVQLDWPRAAIGFVSSLDILPSVLSGSKNLPERFRNTATYRKAFRILVAMAQFSETYKDGLGKKQEAQERRQAILEELIDSLTDRTERSGLIFSLGGTISLGGGARYYLGRQEPDMQGKDARWAVYGPLTLPIGFAMDYYPQPGQHRQCGFHLQVSLFDLGQYLSFDGWPDLHEPDPLASVDFSLILGVWFYNRSLPIVAGLHVGFSPFQASGGQRYAYFGAILGVYVPFLDF